MNKEKTMIKHTKYKYKRELKALKKIEEDIRDNMNELMEDIEEEIKELEGKIAEWTYVESNKYKRLEKVEKNIREKIKESKNKELKLIVAFLVLNGLETKDEILDLVGVEKELKVNKETLMEKLKEPWSGLTIYERHKRATDNLNMKVKEKLNSSLIREDGAKDAVKEIKEELDKSSKASFVLADTENTHMNHEVTSEVIEEIIDIIPEYGFVEYVYNAVLDDRVCPDCASRHGEVFNVGEEPELPMHPKCRCFYTPITEIVSKTLITKEL